MSCLVAAGCLPRGEPPAGRQLVADRTSVLAGIVPSTGDGTLRALFLRPGLNPPPDNPNLGTSDLYVVSAPANGDPPSEQLLAASIPLAIPALACSPNGQAISMCFASDARGRIFVSTSYDPSTGATEFQRIDPVTGERLALASSAYVLSPSRQRLLVFALNEPGTGPPITTTATLYEADDRATVIEVAGASPFIGEDLYYTTAQQELVRIAPGGASEVLATGVDAFGVIGPTNALLVLSRILTADSGSSIYSIFDPATGQETPSPIAADAPSGAFSFSASPGGRWLAHVDPSRDFMNVIFTFFDRVTGGTDVLQLPSYFLNYQWRPGHDAEFWIGSGQSDDQTTWIKQPGDAAVSISGLPSFLTEATNPSIPSGFFTPDGATWFSQKPVPGPGYPAPEIQVGSADDPGGPRFDLVPSNQTLGLYWQLADGRILMPTYKRAPARSDIYAFDPATGDARLLGEAGRVTAVGQTRLLETVHVVDNPGDLVAVDLANGQSTVLAAEFTVSAFVESQGADAVAPGAHVAYQFLARFESPYDGIWIATVP